MTSLLVVVGILVIGLILWFFMQNREFEVRRSKVIHAPIEKVFNAVADLKEFNGWNPWMKYEPNVRVKFSKATNGVGAFYSWEGKKVGSGKMTNTTITPHKSIEQNLEFFKPMHAKHLTSWEFKPTDLGVEVTWTMSGRMSFFLAFLASKMDKWLGTDFEMGLDYLAMWVDPNFPLYSIDFKGAGSSSEQKIVYVNYQINMKDLPSVFDKASALLNPYVAKEKIELSGTFFARYNSMDFKTLETNVDICLGVKKKPNALIEGIQYEAIPPMKFTRAILKGDYPNLPKAWHAFVAHASMYFKRRYKMFPSYEHYLNTPMQVKPAELLTELRLPLKN